MLSSYLPSTIVSGSENGQADVLIRPGKADSWFSLHAGMVLAKVPCRHKTVKYFGIATMPFQGLALVKKTQYPYEF